MKAGAAQRGFTIIEALVALMILSIAATAILAVFSAGARQSSARSARYRLYHAAQSELAAVYADVRAGGGEFDRAVEHCGYRIRERSRLIATTADSVDRTHLFEISATVEEATAPGGRAVTLSDFVRTGEAQ